MSSYSTYCFHWCHHSSIIVFFYVITVHMLFTFVSAQSTYYFPLCHHSPLIVFLCIFTVHLLFSFVSAQSTYCFSYVIMVLLLFFFMTAGSSYCFSLWQQGPHNVFLYDSRVLIMFSLVFTAYAPVPLCPIYSRMRTNWRFEFVRVIILGHSSNDNDNDNQFEQRSSRPCSFGRSVQSFEHVQRFHVPSSAQHEYFSFVVMRIENV